MRGIAAVPGGVTLRGAGMDKTVVTQADARTPSTEALPDPEMRLVTVSDAERLANPPTGRSQGPEAPLQFRCGAQGEFTVTGWEVRPAADAAP